MTKKATRSGKSSRHPLILYKNLSKAQCFVLFVLVVLLLSFIFGFVKNYSTFRNVSATTKTASTQANAKQGAINTKIKNEVEAVGGFAPIASSKVSYCHLEPEYSGWLVDHWNQVCGLRYVEGFETDLDKPSAQAKILSSQPLVKEFGLHVTQDSCKLFQGEDENSITTTIVLREPTSTSTGRFCEIPHQNPTPTSVANQHREEKSAYSFDETSFEGSSKVQIWIVREPAYSKTNVGCGWDWLCSNPPFWLPVKPV